MGRITSGSEPNIKAKCKDLKQEVKFGKLKLPTKATLNLYGSKLFYFGGGTNAIYCYDLETQKHVCVEVPYQIIGGKKCGIIRTLFTPKEYLTAKDEWSEAVTSSHGYLGYGWGHVNIAEPLRIDDKLWLGGIGVIYIIDLSKPFFSPEIASKLSQSILSVKLGPMVRWPMLMDIFTCESQKDLFKLKLK